MCCSCRQTAPNQPFVKYEVFNAEELHAKGTIDRILVICLDDGALSVAEPMLGKYNFVRKVGSANAISRIIQGQLLIVRAREKTETQPFVGRRADISQMTDKLVDPKSAKAKALFVSSISGNGRRTFVRHLYEDVFPFVLPVYPEVTIEPLDGYDEIFRKILSIHKPLLTLRALRTYYAAFASSDDKSKTQQIADLIGSLIEGREAVFIVDRGGLLADNGSIQGPFGAIYSKINVYQYPGVIFIAERMVPTHQRASFNSCVFHGLSSLSSDDAKQLIGLRLRAAGVRYSNNELELLVELSDFHPFNIEFIVEAVKQYTLPVFLADPEELRVWKHKLGSEFLKPIKFEAVEVRLVAALKNFSGLSFDSLIAIGGETSIVANALTRLIDLHVVEGNGDLYSLSRPLKVAIEKDDRFRVSRAEAKGFFAAIAKSLKVSDPDKVLVSVSLVEANIVAGTSR